MDISSYKASPGNQAIASINKKGYVTISNINSSKILQKIYLNATCLSFSDDSSFLTMYGPDIGLNLYSNINSSSSYKSVKPALNVWRPIYELSLKYPYLIASSSTAVMLYDYITLRHMDIFEVDSVSLENITNNNTNTNTITNTSTSSSSNTTTLTAQLSDSSYMTSISIPNDPYIYLYLINDALLDQLNKAMEIEATPSNTEKFNFSYTKMIKHSNITKRGDLKFRINTTSNQDVLLWAVDDIIMILQITYSITNNIEIITPRPSAFNVCNLVSVDLSSSPSPCLWSKATWINSSHLGDNRDACILKPNHGITLAVMTNSINSINNKNQGLLKFFRLNVLDNEESVVCEASGIALISLKKNWSEIDNLYVKHYYSSGMNKSMLHVISGSDLNSLSQRLAIEESWPLEYIQYSQESIDDNHNHNHNHNNTNTNDNDDVDIGMIRLVKQEIWYTFASSLVPLRVLLGTTDQKEKYSSQQLLRSLRSFNTGIYEPTVAGIFYLQMRPDPKHGLGIRLDVLNGKTIVESFKNHPTTGSLLIAEKSGQIKVGDELLSVDGVGLQNQSLKHVVSTIRSLLDTCTRGAASRDTIFLTLAFKRECSIAKESSSSSSGCALTWESQALPILKESPILDTINNISSRSELKLMKLDWHPLLLLLELFKVPSCLNNNNNKNYIDQWKSHADNVASSGQLLLAASNGFSSKSADLFRVLVNEIDTLRELPKSLVLSIIRSRLEGITSENSKWYAVESGYALFENQQQQSQILDKLLSKNNDTNGNSNRINDSLHYGGFWEKRHEAGKTSEADEQKKPLIESDFLSWLCSHCVPLWLHDIEPLFDLIEQRAMLRFKEKRDSMLIFPDLILAGRAERLKLLAKTDSNVMGSQLVNLLNIDFNTEQGRKAIQKNAFALMRLGRYRHAIACFLCAQPPMLKEACRLATSRLRDPLLALLIARLVEHPQFHKRSKSGIGKSPFSMSSSVGSPLEFSNNDKSLQVDYLGPIAMEIVQDSIPTLLDEIESQQVGDDDYGNHKELKSALGINTNADAVILRMNCAVFAQNRNRLNQDLVTSVNKLFDMKDIATGCDVAASVGALGLLSRIRGYWKEEKEKIRNIISESLCDLIESERLIDSRCTTAAFNLGISTGVEEDGYKIYCEMLQDRIEKSAVNKVTEASVEPKVEEVIQKKSSGFNFAKTTNTSSSNSGGSSGSIFDSFDMPPPKRGEKKSSSATAPSALDAFDMPPPRRLEKKTAPPSALDAFDMPPSRQKSALDFDMDNLRGGR